MQVFVLILASIVAFVVLRETVVAQGTMLERHTSAPGHEFTATQAIRNAEKIASLQREIDQLQRGQDAIRSELKEAFSRIEAKLDALRK